MLSKLAYLALCRSIQLLVLLARGDTRKDLEILVLRQQLAVLRRQIACPKLQPADRAVLAALRRALPRSRWSCFFVKPDTIPMQLRTGLSTCSAMQQQQSSGACRLKTNRPHIRSSLSALPMIRIQETYARSVFWSRTALMSMVS